MSSGGIEWAYRMIGRHKLDALGVAVVLHLGLRDVPNFRTDRGIARALNKDRASVRRATQRLEELGLIARRSGQWVAFETVAIVEEKPGAPKPDPSHSDGVGASGLPPRHCEKGGGLRPPGVGASGLRKRGPQASTRKETDEKKGPPAVSLDFEKMTARQIEALRTGLETFGFARGSQAFADAQVAADRWQRHQTDVRLSMAGGELLRKGAIE